MPEHNPLPRLAAPRPSKLAVVVDLVVIAGRVGLRRAEPFGEADEHDPAGRADGSQVVVDATTVG
jgi:hypothetical protein